MLVIGTRRIRRVSLGVVYGKPGSTLSPLQRRGTNPSSTPGGQIKFRAHFFIVNLAIKVDLRLRLHFQHILQIEADP